jgi:Sulfotransferase domain
MSKFIYMYVCIFFLLISPQIIQGSEIDQLCTDIFNSSSVNLSSPDHDKFVVVTPEKCGTFLIMKGVTRLLNLNWRMYWNRTVSSDIFKKILLESEICNYIQQFHLFYDQNNMVLLKKLGFKVVLLLRDPRDQLISLLFFVRDKKWLGLPGVNIYTEFGSLSFDEQLIELITGEKYGISAPNLMFSTRYGFLIEDPETVFIAHFENLVGELGGGSREKQIIELLNIAKFLNVNLTDEEILYRTKDIYGSPGEGTFRSGQIGEWRKYFKDIHIEKFKKVFGNELIELGYENNHDW